MFIDQRPAIRSMPLPDLTECFRQMVMIRLFEIAAEDARAPGIFAA
ncbi:MAG: hypothetical protein HC850_09570 [Rhodomicrobium sp.]|nr:hypothetical protein [Rhodomicrobium sp.]